MPTLRFAVRALIKSPGFTISTILTLALGLGATTAIFSVLYAVLLRPFAYPDTEQLVVLWQKGAQMEMSISWPTVRTSDGRAMRFVQESSETWMRPSTPSSTSQNAP